MTVTLRTTAWVQCDHETVKKGIPERCQNAVGLEGVSDRVEAINKAAIEHGYAYVDGKTYCENDKGKH